MSEGSNFDLDGLDPVALSLVELVLRLVGGDFGARGIVPSADTRMDPVTVSLNMLAESFQRENEARARAEVLLADAIDSYELAPDALCSCELQTLRLVKCNTALSHALGIPREELLGQSLLDFVQPESRCAMERAMERLVLENLTPSLDVELIGPAGRIVASVSGALKYDTDGAPLRILLSLRDETSNRELVADLVEAQRLDALGRLAGGVAHDFNNLLLVIGASAELLGSKLGAESNLKDELTLIRDASARAASLTRDLLAFARQEATPPGHIVLDNAVRSAEALLTRLVGATFQLDFELDAGATRTVLALGQVSQVLTNLVMNAKDAMPNGGRIVVSTGLRAVHPGDDAELTGVVPGEYVELRVQDSGTGIEPSARARIFEPFFTTKATGQGTGLGLSIVHGIVRQAHGYVKANSPVTGGTVFNLLFPVADQREVRPSEPPPGLTVGAPQLLVVDDERLVRTLTSKVLRGAGYQVLEASSGQEAVDLVRTGNRPIALLVCDVVMPGMDGLAVLEGLRALQPELPCLFVTGYAREEARIATLPRVNLLHKPFTPNHLIYAVRALLPRTVESDASNVSA